MEQTNHSYWVSFVEKLSLDLELDSMIPGVLEELCTTFDFGCGFAYRLSYQNMFCLQGEYRRYPSAQLHQTFCLTGDTFPHLFSALADGSPLLFTDTTAGTSPLEMELDQLFGSKSIVLVPALDKQQRVIALVGLADRRSKCAAAQNGENRRQGVDSPENLAFSRSILQILANYIKMQLYRTRAEDAQASLEGTLDHMGIDVYVNDFQTHEILYLNRSMAAPYGTVEQLKGKICWQVFYGDRTEACEFCPRKHLIDDDGNPTKTHCHDYQRPLDGAWFRVFSAPFHWVDGRLAHIVTSVDITESKQNEALIRRIAEYDLLTGLPNRYCLNRYLETELNPHENGGSEYYIIFFDLDGFKTVNDTMGHQMGDCLLQKIGSVLQTNPLTHGVSYRYGGDEFVVVIKQTQPGALQSALEVLHDLFSNPIELEGYTARVGASIGISHYPDDDEGAGELIRKADRAMYTSKHTGKGRVFFYNRGNICSMENLPHAR